MDGEPIADEHDDAIPVDDEDDTPDDGGGPELPD